MNNLAQTIWVEMLKVRRSRMPVFTALGFSLMPLAGGFFMIILKDPALARRMGLISAKAQLLAGVADWPTYLGLLAQAVAVGGTFLFGLIGIWVFGREYADHTVKDLLALPTPRASVVSAKFVVIAVWSAALTVLIGLLGLGVGAAVGLPPVPFDVLLRGALILAGSACLTIMLVAPIVFFAGAGHGYLPPLGAIFLAAFLAQVIAVAGWGEFFPWSIPALYSQGEALGIASYVIVLLTSLAGIAATFAWWEFADQTW